MQTGASARSVPALVTQPDVADRAKVHRSTVVVTSFTGGFMTELIGLTLHRTGSDGSVFAVTSAMNLASLAILHLLIPKIGHKS